MRAVLTSLVVSYNVWFTVPLAIVCLLLCFRLAKGIMRFKDEKANVGADTKTQRLSFDSVFKFLNAGRVPLIVVLMLLFATWGITGLLFNVLLNVPEKPDRVWISGAIALCCCFFGTRYISIALLKLFPRREKTISDVQLLGLSGRVISGQITTTFGTARVQVPDGPELTVSCRAKSDEATPVKGDTVILIDYDDAKRIFDVRKAELKDAD